MNELAYLNFDLLIEPAEPDYRVRVLASPAGETQPVSFQVPFSDLEVENFLLKIGSPRRNVRAISAPQATAIKAFGDRLFEAVFSPELHEKLAISLSRADAIDAGLRIRLRFSDCPELADLPWEYLYDREHNRFLTLSDRTPLVRYLEVPGGVRALPVRPPLRILVVVASPSDLQPLDGEKEWSNVTTALNELTQRGRVEVVRLAEPTLGALQRQLRRDTYHVFHFIGHGGSDPQTQAGMLAMEDDHGRARLVAGEDLGTLLHDHRSLRLAVLNSCEGARGDRANPFSGTAQSLSQQGIPAVVAMQFEITDEAAITFSHVLYEAIADGYPLDAATAEARKAIYAGGNWTEWGTPVLYLGVPDGRIFDIQDRPTPVLPPSAAEQVPPAAEQRAPQEAAEQAWREAEQRARREAAAQQARQEAEERARWEAEQRVRQAAEQARREAEERVRPAAEPAWLEAEPPVRRGRGGRLAAWLDELLDILPSLGESSRSVGAPGTATPVVDERRLQAELRDEFGQLRKDAFVAGQRHQLRIRIAAEKLKGGIIASGLFRSPTPGRKVKLSVMIRLRSPGQKPVIRALSLPAIKDSRWTRPIPLHIPREESHAIIEVVVLHQGRTVQAATLSGPVVARSDPVGSQGMVFAIDADTPVQDLELRTTADATIVLSPSLGDAPEVIDLTAGASPIRLDRLQESVAQIRQQLIGAFGRPPKDLAAAAPLLARLAIRGASLRDALGGGNGFHDDAAWVHVLAYDQADLPFEVIYTHPEPVSRKVPVCASALAGETTCRLDCPDRESAERVCPYAFWGTSKVVERRWYVADRSKNKPPTTRRIPIAARAVVGTSNQTDQEDRTASQRIRSSIEKFVGQQNVYAVPTWKELPAAVADRPSPSLLVLVTHTIPASGDDNTDVRLELGGMALEARLVGLSYVNPANAEPGPVVLSLGCDTSDLTIGFNNWVGRLHASGAEVVVSTLSPVPGKEVADFVVRVFDELPRQLSGPGQHRLGTLLTAVRKATMATGDPLALTITAWGDGDVELV